MTAMIVEAALRGLALALVVGLGLGVLRVRNVPARKAAWTMVLLALLAMPALMRWPIAAGLPQKIGWTVAPLGTRVVQRSTAEPAPAVASARGEAVAPVVNDAGLARSAAVIPAITSADAPWMVTPNAPVRPTFQWPPVRGILAWMYLSVAGALLLRLLIGVIWAMRIWATAEPVSPLVAPEPYVRASARIPSPVTIGSGIVLPADYPEWDHAKLRMVLAHERSHVRQMDFYLQLLSGLYTAVFWFSPVGWWLRRALASLGEAMGDRAGMDAGASRSEYAQVVLEFAAVPRSSLPGVAMACSGNLSRRVESMLSENWLRSAFAEGRRRAVASLLVIPAAIFAVTALVRVPAAAAQAAPQSQQAAPAQAPATGQSNPPEDEVTTTAPADQQAPSVPAAPPSSAAPAPAAPGAAPASAPPAAAAPAAPDVAPAAADQQAPPAPPADGRTMAITGDGNGVTVTGPNGMVTAADDAVNGYGFRFSSDGDSYALVEGPGNKLSFSGDWSGEYGAEIERARRSTNGPFLWFRHNGKSYIVTDPAIIAKIRSLYEPMKDLGIRQRLLGQTEANLGKEQEALAKAERDAAQVRMPDMSKEMADLNEALAKMKADQANWNDQKLADLEAKMKADQDQMLTPEKLAEMQEKLAAVQAEWTPQRMAELEARMGGMQAKLGQLEGEAGAKAGEFGSKMGGLGEEQGRLGAEQGRLGEQEGKLAQDANRQVQQIILQSLGDGRAKPVQ
ncbi:MAG TPA: M56 family metallopeptidase [Acidobacteriaceae bacterium]